MNLHNMNNRILLLSACIFLLAACKPSMPSDVIKPKKMEDILYDYHFAENIPSGGLNQDMARSVYLQAVLDKHGVTKAEFDRALQYYSRYTKQLHEIYQHLEKRYDQDLIAMGGSTQQSADDILSLSGDTANVWSNQRMVMLLDKKPFNKFSFEIPVDTSFHDGDQLTLQFNSDYVPRELNKGACAVLNVVFNNDSTGVMQTQMQSNNKFRLPVHDFRRKGIKQVRGYFLMNHEDKNSSGQSLHGIIISNIQLVRIHHEAPKVEDAPLDAKLDTLTPHRTQIGHPQTDAPHKEPLELAQPTHIKQEPVQFKKERVPVIQKSTK